MNSPPLVRMLAVGAEARPDALSAFRVARRAFLAGRRIGMQELAGELGVNRATLFRWVGGRDQLLAAIIWSLTVPTFRRAVDDAGRTRGGNRVATVLRNFSAAAVDSMPLMSFVQHEPERALRLLTTRATDFQVNLLGLVESLVKQEVKAGRVDSPLPLHDLAYVVLRISETFVYADAIAGETPNPAKVYQAIRALLRP